jgi:hypothetical protein
MLKHKEHTQKFQILIDLVNDMMVELAGYFPLSDLSAQIQSKQSCLGAPMSLPASPHRPRVRSVKGVPGS